ncbi:MAG: hypothetical protein IID41_00140 [Planctomycetes bacterium]|nr:hypothetical protein [Planctomycetota bacterium]
MPVSGLNQGYLASRNPPLQNMALGAVEIIAKAPKVTEQQLLAEIDETQFPDDAFLDFEHVYAFLKITAAGVAFGGLDFHDRGETAELKKVQLIYLFPPELHARFASARVSPRVLQGGPQVV